MRVLVVDDNPDDLEILRDGLEDAGIEVITVGSVDDACKVDGEFDFVLLDLQNPPYSGVDVVDYWRKNACCKGAIIAMSGQAIWWESAIKDGAAAFHNKGWGIASLVTKLTALESPIRAIKSILSEIRDLKASLS